MMGDRSLLKNFIEKFMGIVRFGNDNFTAITGYGDYIQGNITIFHVYYIKGLGHNLFSVGKFCDGDLEVAFRSKTCYVRNLEGDDLLTGGRESNLYTIFISDMAASSPVCLMSKATSTKSWLWHRRLSHLNFGTINDLTTLDLVDGLPKFKYGKDRLCSACERGKSKKASHPPKLVPSDHFKLELLHMDLCGPMKVAFDHYRDAFSVIYLTFAHSRYSHVGFRGSMVTYHCCFHPFERVYQILDPREVVVPEHKGAWMLDDPYVHICVFYTYQWPPSPDYIPGPEEPQSPPLLDFVPKPIYPEFMPPKDEILPAEEQPLPAADSPGYIPESDLEEDAEEDDNEDPKEDPVDYPADEGDDGDVEDEPSDDDVDEEVDIEADDKEEDHPAPADSTVVALLAIDQASSAEETKPFETDESATTPPPHPAYRIIASTYTSITLGPRYEVGESLSAAASRPARGLRVDYGFVATMDREIKRDLERDDRRVHACTARLMEAKARMSREAWGRSMDASDLAHAKAADRRRQVVITEMLAVDHRRQKQFIEALKLVKRLQTEMTEFERQQGPTKGPAQPDAPKEAGSSS
ncbi:integrase, catalytic region, zinc finger, CCHC-type containing protein [Tanacetum coccineum]|uniref:Integrase, catalytic region, zinc finger, CCHC-type containing protein n=1 Tax=Tanacetum coccineum TaxID=301880 RepID=A0ABQ5F8T8_9ASTR